jgi:polyisoprenoid-binding protein YceI
VQPTQRPKRRWLRWLIGALVVLIVAVVGGPFVFIHFIEGKAPPPLTLSSQPTTATTAGSGSSSGAGGGSSSGSSSADGSWKISTGSQTGYRVKETLFGQSNTAVGRTTAITGSITISGTNVTAASFSVDLTQVSSDQSERDNQFQGRIMDTSTFPTATFTLTRPITLGSLPTGGTAVAETATGNLTMHGTTRPVTFHVLARRTGVTIQVSGTIPITFADWHIDNPSGGPATTGNTGTLEFLLDLTRS